MGENLIFFSLFEFLSLWVIAKRVESCRFDATREREKDASPLGLMRGNRAKEEERRPSTGKLEGAHLLAIKDGGKNREKRRRRRKKEKGKKAKMVTKTKKVLYIYIEWLLSFSFSFFFLLFSLSFFLLLYFSFVLTFPHSPAKYRGPYIEYRFLFGDGMGQLKPKTRRLGYRWMEVERREEEEESPKVKRMNLREQSRRWNRRNWTKKKRMMKTKKKKER